MNSFYKSIGLFDSSNFSIEMEKSEFVDSLKKITYKTNTSFISLIPDNGIPTRFEYRGIVNNDDFTIKRRLHFFDFKIPNCIIKGNISEENDKTLVKIEFMPLIFHFLSFIFVSLFALIIVIQISKSEKNYFILAIPFIITIIQYFSLKRNIQRNKYDFERELNFIAQKNSTFKNFK